MPRTVFIYPSHDRKNSVLHALRQENAGLSEEDRQLKYEKMRASPYRFFRGSNHLFWADFAGDWRLTRFGNRETHTWIQGDAHVYNLGAFTNHQGRVIYGLDDFDDALIADYQYDLWRMAISILLMARENDNLDAKRMDKLPARFARAYLSALADCEPEDREREIHFTRDTTRGKLADFLEKVEHKKNRRKLLEKWTLNHEGQRRFDLASAKLSEVTPERREAIVRALAGEYRRTLARLPENPDQHLAVLDVAERLNAGTGSLGLNRYYVLIEGDPTTRQDDCILDIKQQTPPTPYHFLGPAERQAFDARHPHPAAAHAEAFHALAEHPDPYLGWLCLDDACYSVRERSPFKADFPTEKLDKYKHYQSLVKQWGRILATEHRRAAARLYSEPCQFERTVARLCEGRGKILARLVAEVAVQYAERVRRDWQIFDQHFDALLNA